MLPDRYRLEFHVSSLSVTRYYSVKFGKNAEMRKTSAQFLMKYLQGHVMAELVF